MTMKRSNGGRRRRTVLVGVLVKALSKDMEKAQAQAGVTTSFIEVRCGCCKLGGGNGEAGSKHVRGYEVCQ
ncbi:uncharacterized protein K452DRAFT_83539 [Aplosporella prunicola CBS 121167]|uniref:Uncharacterized protein n=1 Tax=Aplosporella prunicola CBS 121167 TaxID=1176127 RepID=A0A6A6B3E3_9PEZI|nr:uncharacterized protein K452DRAFT_83539 [Aplosporella prunicola CBS 121167]KAF2138719.1 hypothetical protein K452DRAFT_83539 [Aplosporella prunicola CBS 121167]